MKKKLPNQSAILVLGIISICTCLLVGLTCGIISLILAKKSLAIYKSNPEAFDESSVSVIKSGRICAIIGTSIAGATTFLFLFYLLIFGAYFSIMASLFELLSN